MDWLKIASCIFRTSTIRGGRISQGARRRCDYVHGWTVFRKEPGGGAIMSMDGQKNANGYVAIGDYVHGWTVFRKEPVRLLQSRVVSRKISYVRIT